MSRRAWRAWGVTALLGLSLSCAPRRPAPPTEIVFWVSSPVAAVEPLAARFTLENPGLRVRLVALPAASGLDSVLAAVQAGTPPDLCEVRDRQAPALLAGNSLSDWSAGVADLRGGLRGWELCMVGDAIYGLPWLLHSDLVYFDKSLFARAGLDSTRGPRTWDELRATAARVRRLGDGIHGYGISVGDSSAVLDAFLPYLWSNGGELATAALDSSRIDSPANLEALEFMLSLRPVALLASADSLAAEFTAGRLGLLLAGPGLVARLAAVDPPRPYGVALVPQPMANRGTHTSRAGGNVLVSFTASRRKEAALKLARFLVRPEASEALAAAIPGARPASLAADSASVAAGAPEADLRSRQLRLARFPPTRRDWPALSGALGGTLLEALAGRRTAHQALAAADTLLQSRLGAH